MQVRTVSPGAVPATVPLPWPPHAYPLDARFKNSLCASSSGPMFLKARVMFERNRASKHATYNYTNQNDTITKYEALSSRKLILVTLSESKWRDRRLELETDSPPCIDCHLTLCNVRLPTDGPGPAWPLIDTLIHAASSARFLAIDIQGTLSPSFGPRHLDWFVLLRRPAPARRRRAGPPRPEAPRPAPEAPPGAPEAPRLQRSKIRNSLECRSYVGTAAAGRAPGPRCRNGPVSSNHL